MSQDPPQSRNFFEEWRQRRAQAAEAEKENDGDGGQAVAVPSPAASTRPEETPEFFEWTEDRDRAIQEFLETTTPGTLPSVHRQLLAILQGLRHGNLAKEPGWQLLAEVEAYLDQKIRAEECKVPVAHPVFLSARADKLKAFYAWEEACSALRTFMQDGEGVQLEVAAYACDQGSAFLAAARRLLLESEPLEDEPFSEDDHPNEGEDESE